MSDAPFASLHERRIPPWRLAYVNRFRPLSEANIHVARKFEQESRNVFTAYKKVANKIKPVIARYPEDARVERRIPENPLLTLPPLPTHPPAFTPTERISEERVQLLNINPDGFLWPEEETLFAHVMVLNEDALAFEESQRGTFKESYFSPYIIPTVPHEPWKFKNIPIPPGLRDEMIKLLKEKVDAGVYEPCQSAYCSRWFCVKKKNGKLRIVHDLQPLNKISIRDSGMPPIVDDFVEPFSGRVCCTVFDLFWGFDARKMDPRSRDLTAFLSPLGALRLTSMPMGYTNSPAEFQNCMAFLLQEEMPHVANVFIDDLAIKGPTTEYLDAEGKPEVLAANPGIRRFIWEHAQDVHRVLHRVKCAGGTFSGAKTQVARREVVIVGQKCTPNGRSPEDKKVSKVQKWPALTSAKDVRGFLGLCGTVRIWIPNYSRIARPLTELTRHDIEFIWDKRRQAAFDDLKKLVSSAPALRSIDYTSENPVILSVDSSYIAVGFILSQLDDEGRRRPARYGSLPMSPVEARYSQPKLELFGLYRALRHFRLYLIGVKCFFVEVDAKYIKGMLEAPDLQPNAAINRWIQGILMFDFTLIHVSAERFKGPDALSRRLPASDDESVHEDDEWLDKIALLAEATSVSTIQVALPSPTVPPDVPADCLVSSAHLEQSLREIYNFWKHASYPANVTLPQDDRRFLQKASRYFLHQDVLYRKNGSHPPLKVIFTPEQRRQILTAAHEGLGHRGEQAVWETIRLRFFWPHLRADVKSHVGTCHACQIRSTKKMRTPLMVSTPSMLWQKVYIDVMFMPQAKGFRYIIAARDDLSRASEGRALRTNTAQNAATFLWEQIYCRYGAVGQVVTDNGSEFIGKAFSILMDRYSIPRVTISTYNSKANGVVERGHFNIRESIVKACEGNLNRWPDYVLPAFFADRVTTSAATGLSPYYLLHGTHPVLPFDLSEATWMVKSFRPGMTRVDLLAARIRQLMRLPEDVDRAARKLAKFRFNSKAQFEKKFTRRLQTVPHEPGALVLIRNSRFDGSISGKALNRYFGPFIVHKRTQNGSYTLTELDGTGMRSGWAGFRLLPYLPRDRSTLHDIATDKLLDEEEYPDTIPDLLRTHGESDENTQSPSEDEPETD